MIGGTTLNTMRRYPVSFAIKYVTGFRAEQRTILGETVWMSRGEVAFMAKEAACVGDMVAMSIEWPVLLQGKTPLQLTVSAQIVERAGFLSVARLMKHEFRTRGFHAMAARPRTEPSVCEALPARKITPMDMSGRAQPPQPLLVSAAAR